MSEGLTYRDYDTEQARRYIDASRAEDEIHGLNGCVGELLSVLTSLVAVIDSRDHFSMLEHARRLIAKAEGR